MIDDAPYYAYKSDSNGAYKTIYGNNVSKVEFTKKYDYYEYIKNNKGKMWESDISPIYKFLSDTFAKSKNTNLNIGYFDIEVDFDLNDGLGYPRPDNPFGEINSISLFDARKQEYHMIVLEKTPFNISLEDEEFPVILHKCVTERQLIDTFASVIDDIDILSAWNGHFFDIPYIMQRCIKIYGRSVGLTKLCRDGYKAYEKTVEDNYKNEVVVYDLVGRVHLDMMLLYKNFTFGEKPSYALDNICVAEKVGAKIDYKGDLGELYRTDPQRFFDYSLHDARLLYHLDDKKKLVELAITLVQGASIKYSDVFGSIKPLEHTIRNYCHYERDEVLILPDKRENKKEEFVGAFVIKTKADVYGWSFSVDLGSLYPSCIRTVNISPETHIMQCVNDDLDFIKIVERSDELITINTTKSFDYYMLGNEAEGLSKLGGQSSFTLTGKEIYDMLREKNYTISAFGSIFSENRGIIPEVLDLWVGARKEAKNKMFEYEDKVIELKSQNGLQSEIDSAKVNVELYNLRQMIAKLYNNSLYGAISNQYSRFYTIYCAASITTTGQAIEKFQIQKTDQLVRECK